MKPCFDRIAVLGLGLLGGSVALASKQRGLAKCVAGGVRRPAALEAAVARGIVDEGGSFEEAVRGANLVVLATPVFAMVDLVRTIAPHLQEGALVTDVGSVKAGVAEALPGLLPRGVHYVGAHPMAGSHLSGLDHARGDLFDGAPCVVIEGAPEAARDRVSVFWTALGARVLPRNAATHDGEVAWMSHIPHILAFAFAGALKAAPSGADEVAGSGFHDFTRIAHSHPELWGDILTSNRKAIAAPLQSVAESLAELGRAIETGDAEIVERWLAQARAALSLASPPPAGKNIARRVRTAHSRGLNASPGSASAAAEVGDPTDPNE